MIGNTLGPYQILAELGRGGMGEVYRARDTKLGRDVAIKILPDVFVRDAGRLARFEREARTLASLNHPNIAQIYGLETSPDLICIVMELVDGEDLQAVIARGPMPLADAMPIARQIAQALETAHEQGIVHRDLKPANIKVRPDGTVKVLDFGLAKGGDPGLSSSGSLVDSPTMTSPAMTEMGMIIGTAAYMSPEQARGKAVDRRADVWAFGVVLYEMLSGRRAFGGGEVSDVLASVLKDSLPLETLPPGTPASIRRLLRRCLEKDRAERLDSMAAARLEIAEALSPKDSATATGGGLAAGRLRTLGVPVAAAIAGAALAGFLFWRFMPAPAPVPSSFALSPPGGGPLAVNINQPDLAISPDGRRIVYGGGINDDSALIVRTLDGFGDTALQNLGRQPRSPFFSPDGRWMGYFAAADTGLDAHLMKWPVSGGAPVEIAKVVGNLRGAAWLPDNTIVFASATPSSGLLRVSANASGGNADVLTVPNSAAGETDHLWPSPLPGGKHVLFTITRALNDAGSGGAFDIAAMDVATKQWRVIQPGGSYPRYMSTGHLVYATERGLMAVEFDPGTLEIRGDARVVIDDMVFKPTTGAADVSVSETGTIAYVAGSAQNARQLMWMDRRGQTSPASPEPRRYLIARLSPNGRQAAVVVNDSGAPALWVLEFDRGTMMPLTSAGMAVTELSPPVWSESGREIFFAGTTASGRAIFRVAASGTGPPQLVIGSTPEGRLVPSSVVPGRPALLVTRTSADGRQEVHVLTLDGTPALTPLLAGANANAAVVSPDGRWVAYLGAEGGSSDVYLRPFPDVSADRIKVSSGGSRTARWAGGGRQLFYQEAAAGRQIWMVEVGAPGIGTVGKPVKLTMPETSRIESSFDVATDGQRLLVIQPHGADQRASELRVIVSWFETLKEKFRR